MTKSYIRPSGLLLSIALSACGGGGGDGGNTSASIGNSPPLIPAPGLIITSSAEGAYQGKISNGVTHLSLVLENDEIYVLYAQAAGEADNLGGFLRGQGKSRNGSFTASDLHNSLPGTNGGGYAFSGTYVSGASLNGTMTSGTDSLTFSGTALSNTTYLYNTPARLSNIVGDWSLHDLRGDKVMLSVGTDGKFTGTSGACLLAGTLTPRGSGKNVFDFSLVYGAAPCALPGQSANGIAVEYSVGSVRQLTAVSTDSGHLNGTAFVGTR